MSAELKNLRPHDHPCLIYETKEEQVAAFVPYLQAGLAQGEKCLYILDDSDPHWVVDSMRMSNFPVEDYLHSRQFSIITTRDAYLLGGFFDTQKMVEFWHDQLKQADAEGYHALRAAAEMTWALGKEPGCSKLVGYESHLNNIFPGAKVSALCQYNRKRFHARILKDMIHVHPLIVLAGEVIENPGFIRPEDFMESKAEMDVQALIDNLTMSKRLAHTNAQLREALAAQERAQAVIEERQKQCESLYQELLSMAKVVSHELQAPLSKMQSYLRLISVRYKSKLGVDADEFIDESCQAARLIGRMIDDLWNYARVDSTHEATSNQIDCMECLNAAINDLQPLIMKTGAKIDHDLRLPQVRMAKSHLRYLLFELISNSIKYCPDKAPDIFVGAKDEGECWQLYVRDNGLGIDKVHTFDVFRLFYRLNGRPTSESTGMGLAITKRIVEHYGGTIGFESEGARAGTTFYFTIPKDRKHCRRLRDLRKSSAEA